MADPPFTLSNITYDCHREIIRHLDLQAIKNLRLTSRQMKDLCSGPVFNGFLKRQTIDMTRESLESLCRIACYEEFQGLVQELRVRVPFYDLTCIIRMITMQQDVTPHDYNFVACREAIQKMFFELSALELLTSALKQLGRLQMIDIDLVVVTGVGPRLSIETSWWDWSENVEKGSEICSIVMSAIARSGISLEALRIFPDTPVCSVPLYDLASTTERLKQGGYKMVPTELKKFGIKIASRSLSDAAIAFGDLRDSDPPDRGIRRFVSLLGQMPNLEDLELKIFNTLDNNFGSRKILRAIVSRVHYPHLRRCTMGGIYTEESSLVKFLTAHPHLESLDMESFVMVSGVWQPVFKVLSEIMPALKYLRLSNLLQRTNPSMRSREVNLFPCWEEQTQKVKDEYCERDQAVPGPHSLWVHTREFDAEDLQRGLEFWPITTQTFSPRPRALTSGEKYGYVYPL